MDLGQSTYVLRAALFLGYFPKMVYYVSVTVYMTKCKDKYDYPYVALAAQPGGAWKSVVFERTQNSLCCSWEALLCHDYIIK